MTKINASWRIYPNREAAEKVLTEVIDAAEKVYDIWIYGIVMLDDGIRCVISIWDEEGEFIGNLP